MSSFVEKPLRLSATLPILGTLDGKVICKNSKTSSPQNEAIYGVSMSLSVRVTNAAVHCGRSWVIGELQGETNH